MFEYLQSVQFNWREVWLQIQILSTSWLAWRLYVVGAAGLVLTASFVLARRAKNDLLAMAKDNDSLPKRRGAPARKLATLERHREELEALGKARGRYFLRQTLVLFASGLLVPAILLANFIYFYAWFIPNGQALVVDQCGGGLYVPTFGEVAQFVTSQWTMGIDVMLSRDLAVLNQANAAAKSIIPGDPVISSVMLAFRYYIPIFSGVALHSLWVSLRGLPSAKTIKERMLDLEIRIAAARHEAARAGTGLSATSL